MKRHLQVACAIIEHAGMVLAAQRSANMSLPLKWEFPGGKIEAGEEPAGCLERELREELGITVTIGEPLPAATHSYDDFTVTLHPFVCGALAGDLTLHEHHAVRWMKPGQLQELDWAAADLPVIAAYLARPATAAMESRQ